MLLPWREAAPFGSLSELREWEGLASMVQTTSGTSSASARSISTLSVATRSRDASADTLGAGGSTTRKKVVGAARMRRS